MLQIPGQVNAMTSAIALETNRFGCRGFCVEAVDPDCRFLRIRPDLGDLAWAEGVFALPTGEKVTVRVRRTDSGAPEVEVTHPPWITVESMRRGLSP